MIAALLGAMLLALAVVLITSVQVLYLESLRFRPRELPALDFFKETLEPRLRLKTEEGALAFSLIKHSLIVLLALAVVLVEILAGSPIWEAVLAGFLISWLVMIFAAYVVPQFLYRRTSGRWLLPLAPLFRALALATRPVTYVLGFMHSLVTNGDAGESESEAATPSENIEALISAGTEEGIIAEDDRKLIESVVAFGDKTVREVMTPRPNIVAIQENQSLEDLRQLVLNEQFSRIPVYAESIDDFVGFVHVRDMFELDEEQRALQKVKEIMRPIRHVPESKPIHDLLREMQEDGAHMAIVVDEYGSTAGLVTMEDLVEEILGEVRDEHEPGDDVTADPSGGYIVAGSLDVDRLDELVEFRPNENTESTTVGGLVTEWMGRVPNAGESVERDGIRIDVLASNKLRVEQVRIART